MKLLENKTLLIVGLGLIGGSIARGLIAANAGVRILAHGRDEQALQVALLDGNIHGFSTDITTLAPQADIIMLCTPTLTVRPMLQQLATLVGPDTIITDAASVKGNVVADARQHFAGSLHRVVPGHPVAGSEQSGYRASKADLFSNRKVILTPLPENSSLAVRTIMQLWQVLGADVHSMTVERHDQVLAGTSHLPHLLAFTLVNTLVDSVGEPDRARQVFDYAASGFADFSRIASSDPVMWRDIFLANRDATVDVLDAYMHSLEQMKQRLLRGDGSGLQDDFRRAKQVRDEFIRRFKSDRAEAGSDGGFTVEPALIKVRKGSFLQGFFDAVATSEEAVSAIDAAAAMAGVTVLQGVPESITVVEHVRQLGKRAIPVIGPERAMVRVYGETAGESADGMRRSSLPADAFLVGLLVLATAVQPGSSLCIRCLNIGEDLETVFSALAELGVSVLREAMDGGVIELICECRPLRAARLQTNVSALTDEQAAVVLLAAALAPGQSTLELSAEQYQRLVEFLGDLAHWLADFSYEDGILVVTPRKPVVAEFSARSCPALSLLAITAAQVVDAELGIQQPGDIAAHYPGLLGRLTALGMNFTVHQA
ncbi:MAG TPA: prephenate dehydrogenase/arogenate dehydrogenase family protein [Pseudohongiella sp.]|nr:prephenate dehydrogenase/arogenate dehydrogenase family protein [Pseudohongiella sp.]